MKTTKIVSLFLAVLTALSVSACGVSGQSASSFAADSAPAPSTASFVAETSAPTAPKGTFTVYTSVPAGSDGRL